MVSNLSLGSMYVLNTQREDFTAYSTSTRVLCQVRLPLVLDIEVLPIRISIQDDNLPSRMC